MATVVNGTANLVLSKPEIVAVQSVTPMKMTDPRLSRQVSVTDSSGSGIFWRCFHIILYYDKASGEDSGWLVAGWMKESLAKALVEHPMLAGRLRRAEEGDREFEIVSNDSGVRLFEARIPKTLSEFLALKEKEDAEAQLVFWKDIDEQFPQFCPLFYVQVTNFQCGGYSIGISCSILLGDPWVTTSFLKRWADIHSNIVARTDMPKIPMFYVPDLKPNGCSLTNAYGLSPTKNHGQSMIFKIRSKNLNPRDDHMSKAAAALLCIEEVNRKLGVQMASKFSLVVKEPSENIKVEYYKEEELAQKAMSGLITRASWGDLEDSKVAFHEGNKPVHVSHWINSVSGEGLAMVIPSTDQGVSGINIIVTVPNEKQMI